MIALLVSTYAEQWVAHRVKMDHGRATEERYDFRVGYVFRTSFDFRLKAKVGFYGLKTPSPEDLSESHDTCL